MGKLALCPGLHDPTEPWGDIVFPLSTFQLHSPVEVRGGIKPCLLPDDQLAFRHIALRAGQRAPPLVIVRQQDHDSLPLSLSVGV
jgi:hypothetical protein